jgi:hypothetical protein
MGQENKKYDEKLEECSKCPVCCYESNEVKIKKVSNDR